MAGQLFLASPESIAFPSDISSDFVIGPIKNVTAWKNDDKIVHERRKWETYDILCFLIFKHR